MCAHAVAHDATDLASLRVMRDEYPVWRDEEHGVWHVYRYAAVASILSNHHSFSSDFQQSYPDRADLLQGNIVALDPPRHDQLRGLVSLAFTPRRIAQLEERIAHISQELISQIG